MDVFMHVLPLWPTAQATHDKLMRSRQVETNTAQPKHRNKHSFVWSGSFYRCLWCFKEKRTSRSVVDRLPCGNLANTVRQSALSGHQQGHRLLMAHGCDTGLVVVFCCVCAAMATTRAVNLLALSWFGNRIHPKTRESLTQPWPFVPDHFQTGAGRSRWPLLETCRWVLLGLVVVLVGLGRVWGWCLPLGSLVLGPLRPRGFFPRGWRGMIPARGKPEVCQFFRWGRLAFLILLTSWAEAFGSWSLCGP